MNDLFDGLVLVARFTGLDEVCIFNAAGSIVHNLDPVFMSQFRNSFNVSHGNRLSACQIYSNSQADIRNMLCANFIDQCMEFI